MSHKTRRNKFKINNLSTFSNNKQEIISIHQFSKLAMIYWIGGSLMLASVVFPLLFKVLDAITASQIVGQLLNLLAYIGLVCLFIALIEVLINHKFSLIKMKRFWYILVMDFMLIINHFAIFPIIYKLRQNISQVAHSILSVQEDVFDFWHSLSALVFLVICVFGVLYLIEM